MAGLEVGVGDGLGEGVVVEAGLGEGVVTRGVGLGLDVVEGAGVGDGVDTADGVGAALGLAMVKINFVTKASSLPP